MTMNPEQVPTYECLWPVQDTRTTCYDASSWARAEDVAIEKRAVHYQWGEVVQFGMTGNADKFKRKGWSIPFDNHELNDGKEVSLFMLVDAPKGDIALTVSFIPFLHPEKVPRQRVNVLVNGKEVGEWLIEKPGGQTRSLLIPQNVISSEELEIVFKLPDAARPNHLNIGVDGREWALAFVNIIMEEVVPYQCGAEVHFGKGGNAQPWQLAAGWSQPEEGFNWTNGNNAVLAIPLKNRNVDLTLKIRAFPYLGRGKLDQQPVTVYVNKHRVGEWRFDRPGDQEKSIVIPHNLLDDEIQYIEFKLPNAVSPKALGQSEDTRDLAIAVRSMIINCW